MADIGGRLRLWAVITLLGATTAGLVVATMVSLDRNDRVAASGDAAPAVADPVITLAPVWPQVAIIGDSYTSGSTLGGLGQKAWFHRTCASLQWACVAKPVWASGWVSAPAGGNFAAQVPWAVSQRPDVVIFFNGVNDLDQPAGKVGAAVTTTLQRVRRALPEATIIVIGPVSPNRVTRPMVRLRDEVKAVAARVDAVFVDPIREDWFQGANRRYIGSDKFHPVDAGHVYMANLITKDLRRAGLHQSVRHQ